MCCIDNRKLGNYCIRISKCNNERIKRIMNRKKMTQQEVADLVGISLRSYKSYAKDKAIEVSNADLLVSADVKELSVMTTAHLFLFCLIQRRNTAIMNYRSMNITMRWRSAQRPQNIILSLPIKSEIVSWLTVRI